MAGEVIDLRPDRFLRELREHGSMGKACINSGMSIAEFNDLCASNIKFDRSQVECYLEYFEDTIMTEARVRLGKVRIAAYAELQKRHGIVVPGNFEKRGTDDDTNCG